MSEPRAISGELLLEILERVTNEHAEMIGAIGVSGAHIAAMHMRRCAALVARLPEPLRSTMVARVRDEFAFSVAQEAERLAQG